MYNIYILFNVHLIYKVYEYQTINSILEKKYLNIDIKILLVVEYNFSAQPLNLVN